LPVLGVAQQQSALCYFSVPLSRTGLLRRDTFVLSSRDDVMPGSCERFVLSSCATSSLDVRSRGHTTQQSPGGPPTPVLEPGGAVAGTLSAQAPAPARRAAGVSRRRPWIRAHCRAPGPAFCGFAHDVDAAVVRFLLGKPSLSEIPKLRKDWRVIQIAEGRAPRETPSGAPEAWRDRRAGWL
jgi:hypothetical protein